MDDFQPVSLEKKRDRSFSYEKLLWWAIILASIVGLIHGYLE